MSEGFIRLADFVLPLATTIAVFFLAILIGYGQEIYAWVRSQPERYTSRHRLARELQKGLRS